jgi:hypothetical protein
VKSTQNDQNNRIEIVNKDIKSSHFADITSRVGILVLFIAGAVGVILFGRGYRFSLSDKKLSSTGILAISSSPENAQVYINGEFRGATDLNINLKPGEYTVEVNKEGYRSYKQTVKLKGEIVQAIDPILFPINPSLTPLTNLGISKVHQVQNTDRFVIIADSSDVEKDGIYLYEATSHPLDFLPPLSPILLRTDIPVEVDLSKTQLLFSPDNKQAAATFFNPEDEVLATYLLELGRENQDVLDISTSKDALMQAWAQQNTRNRAKILETLPKDIRKIASDSFTLIKYSPDKTKFLYQASQSATIPRVINPPLIGSNQTPEERTLTKDSIYIYDRREDKNFKIDSPVTIDEMYWYTDSKRIIYREKSQVSISLYDGQSRQAVYSGPIEQGFVAVSPDGRVLVLANLNPISNKYPDLYEVGIR